MSSLCTHSHSLSLTHMSSLCSLSHDLSSHTLTHTTVLTHMSPHTHVIPVYSHSLTLTHTHISSQRTCAPTHSLTHKHVIPVNTPMVPYYHQVCSVCSHTMCSHSHSHPHPPILVLPHTSFHLILTHNSSPHTPSPSYHDFTPSCLHHIIIASSPLHHLNHHQSLPLIPHNTPQSSISLPTLPITS